MKTLKKRLQSLRRKVRAGTTLVEMVVTLLVFSILMSMVVAVLHPAAKTFIRMQKLQYAQIILDNTIRELQGITLEASGNGYVKIYRECRLNIGTGGATDLTGDSSSGEGLGYNEGKALEFINLDNYVMLLSVDGIPPTDIYMGTTRIGEEEGIEKGRLAVRYYAYNNNTFDYKETIGNTTTYVARAVTPVFADGYNKNGSSGPVSGYYMGNYLGLEFSFPEPCREEIDSEGIEHKYYDYVNVKVSLYNNPKRESEHLVVEDTAVLDFRYPIERRDTVTAKKTANSTP